MHTTKSALFLAACLGLATSISALQYPFSEVSTCGKTCIKQAIVSTQANKTSACTPSHPACLCGEFAFGFNYNVIDECVQKKCDSDSEAAKRYVLDYFSESCVNQIVSSVLASHIPTSIPSNFPTTIASLPSSVTITQTISAPKVTSAVRRDPGIIGDITSVVGDATSVVGDATSAVKSGYTAATSAASSHENAGSKKAGAAVVGVAAIVAAGVGMAIVGA